MGTDAPGVYRLYLNGEEHPLPDDFCAQGGRSGLQPAR